MRNQFNNTKPFAFFLSAGLLLVSLSGCAKSSTLLADQNEPTAENPREILISTNNDSNPDSFIDENGVSSLHQCKIKAMDEVVAAFKASGADYIIAIGGVLPAAILLDA